MEIPYKNIILRDMVVADIEDEIRWNTVETEWALWDAPWEDSFSGFGLGTEALAAYIRYHLEMRHTDICTETWSGNTRMIKCAKKLGFYECDREIGFRTVRGEKVDGLTFRLDVDRFHKSFEERLAEFGGEISICGFNRGNPAGREVL